MKSILLTCFLAATLTGASAQKAQPRTPQKKTVSAKKRSSQKPAPLTEEEQQLAERLQQMTEATQKVIVIDSFVVDKKVMMDAFKLNPEVGSIVRHDDFFQTGDQPQSFLNVNQMGNKCYFPLKDKKGHSLLYTSDLIGGRWSEPILLQGLDIESYTDINYPFMMTDGYTLFFAAKGPESIGGYDIFVTRYDASEQRLLTPENIGMPFNSTGNDYLYVIDDIEHLGWFVTDRRQPEGKVCIYTFIPNASRDTYSLESTSPEKLKQLAELHRIADTWGNGKERKKALERLKAIEKRKQEKIINDTPAFVVNDHTLCYKASDLKGKGNQENFKLLQNKQQELKRLEQRIETLRTDYHQAKGEKKKELGKRILQEEQRQEELILETAALAKTIRQIENNQ